jgi:hypothetical protein
MDKNLVGRYEALVFALVPGSGLEIVGRVTGGFRVSADGSVLADPVASPQADRAPRASADALVKGASGGSAQASSHLAVTPPRLPALSGVTRMHFMLLD